MENIYLKTKNKKMCNGCTSCMYVCPKHCIHMEENSEGFIYPVVDEEKCIHCGRCLKTCSNYVHKKTTEPKIYAGINTSENILSKSTSGGMFHALASLIFSMDNGVCYGAIYDKDFVVRHSRATTLEEAMDFMGAKYVRSDITGIYEKVLEDLNQGKNVLFTGTPCQTAGLNTFLNKPYDNLVICNIICHSNPSPKVFRKYIKNLELEHNSKIINYTFRSKSNGWANPKPIVTFENKTVIEETSYQTAFARSLIARPCCSECKFVTPYTVSDITIGDFWGIDKITDIKDYSKGVSLLLVNTEKGDKFISNMKNVNLIKEQDIDKCLLYNHHEPIVEHRNREKFFKRLDDVKDEDVIDYMNKMSSERLLRRIIKLIKKQGE